MWPNRCKNIPQKFERECVSLDCFQLKESNNNDILLMPTRHYTTRRDVTRQLSTRKSCGGLRHDKTKTWPCRRYLALSDHSRQGPSFVLSCIVVSFRLMCGGQKRWQRREFLIIRLFSRERNNNDILLRDRISNHQGRRNGFGIGGGGQKISVISKFTELSVYFILIHIHLSISHYFQTLNFLVGKILGGGAIEHLNERVFDNVYSSLYKGCSICFILELKACN